MSDIIKLLPDSVANQIAAGEVVQRPASVVKELLENAIDAEATEIKLIIKDAGRTLVQVTDNGKGMSENDARMCFERHATSKINNAQDLFALRTMGFRGEALASIASVARVELKTRTRDAVMGTELVMEGSRLESQLPCQTPAGTSIAVKNLFFNTPARRNFLKSDTIERTHIYNDFIRVALANPKIAFSYYNNNQLMMQSTSGNLGHRILQLFGNHYKQRLIPVEEQTTVVNIQGYILKPEFAKKIKSEQFLFVNNRFIKSPYLNHAVEFAFDELIPMGSYPSFFLFLETDPAQIDVNVHPTKTEIKFQDEKTIFEIMKAAIRRSLGKFNIAPTLDFERETAFDNVYFDKNKVVAPPTIDINPDYNPFGSENNPPVHAGKNLTGRVSASQWEKLFPQPHQHTAPRLDFPANDHTDQPVEQTILSAAWEKQQEVAVPQKFIQLNGRYIITTIKSGLMIIDQQRAHERILFEKQIKLLESRKVSSQTLLFPEQIKLNETDMLLIREIMDDLASIGFDVSEFGHNAIMVNSTPAFFNENENIAQAIENILEQFKKNKTEIKDDNLINLARSMARSLAIKPGKIMTPEEMNSLTDELFSCEMPYHSPSGKPVIHMMRTDEIAEKFK
jgi:DNA mismatch repair protein MutL